MADPTQITLIPDLLLQRMDAIVEFIPLMTSDDVQRRRATAASL